MEIEHGLSLIFLPDPDLTAGEKSLVVIPW